MLVKVDFLGDIDILLLIFTLSNMDFLLKNTLLSLESDKKVIELSNPTLTLDGMSIEMAGEYEK